jgi:hypothetical protein
MRQLLDIRRGAIFLFVYLFMISVFAQFVAAQSLVESIDISRFPTVELQVSVTKPASTSGKLYISNVWLEENGLPQIVEYFDCPEDSVRLSVAILLDRSSSMARIGDRPDRDSTKMHEAKKAIATFLDLLSPKDEAALFSFTTHNFTLRHIFTVEHDFSLDKAAVKAALFPIIASGGTRLWQAIIDAVAELRDRRGRRVLIVLTDGRNQLGESYHTPAIEAAVAAGIPVYTIGLGSDADIGALSGFASATGGRFHYAPEATELTNVFNTIAGLLMTDACVLRYTSSNPCLDGSQRDIDLVLSATGFSSQADSFYTVPMQLSPVTLSIQPGLSAIARDTLVIPLYLAEQFSTSSPLSYSMTVGYDSQLMQFMRVSTEGTMSAAQPVDVSEPTPGTLRLRRTDMYPFLPTGTLCELVFHCKPGTRDTTAGIQISDAEIRGFCPTSVTVTNGSVTLFPCEDRFLVGDSLRIVLPGNGDVQLVPLRLVTSSPAGAAISATMLIDHAGMPYEIVGVETRRSLCESGGVIMQEIAPGVKEFQASAVSSGHDTVLFYLRVRTLEPQRTSLVSRIPIGGFVAESGCRVSVEQDQGPDWAIVLVDGICEPLLRRRTAPTVANHPNPFQPGTSVAFTIPRDGRAVLRIMDAHGRIVTTLLDAELRKGDYVHHFDAANLPAGEYYALLLTGEQQTVHRMLLLKYRARRASELRPLLRTAPTPSAFPLRRPHPCGVRHTFPLPFSA